MARKLKLAWFAEWQKDPANLEAFWGLLEAEERVRFRDACMRMKLPYMAMYLLVHNTPGLFERYSSILKARAHELAEESLEDVKEAVDRDSAAAAKVKADTKLKIAEKWDQERYGNRVQIDRNVTVRVDAGLIGRAVELLEEVPAPEKVVEGEVLTLPEPVGAQPR